MISSQVAHYNELVNDLNQLSQPSWMPNSMQHVRMEVDELLSLNPDDEWWTGLWQHVMIHDTRSGNRSCDGSGDLSPTFSMFVYVCLCLFTCVWSLDLFWKLYIVPMLRGLTSLSFNINYDILITCLLSEVDPVTGGPAHKLSPSLPLGSWF